MAQANRKTNRSGASAKRSTGSRKTGFATRAKRVTRDVLTGAAVGAVAGAIKAAAEAIATETRPIKSAAKKIARKSNPERHAE